MPNIAGPGLETSRGAHVRPEIEFGYTCPSTVSFFMSFYKSLHVGIFH